jgi:hypothetical protein
MASDHDTEIYVALQILTGLIVAGKSATRTGIPHSLDLTPDGQIATVVTITATVRTGYERLASVAPGTPQEECVGLAKKLYTARCQGEHIPEGVMRIFGPHLVPESKPKRLKGQGDDAALVAHLQAGGLVKPDADAALIEYRADIDEAVANSFSHTAAAYDQADTVQAAEPVRTQENHGDVLWEVQTNSDGTRLGWQSPKQPVPESWRSLPIADLSISKQMKLVARVDHLDTAGMLLDRFDGRERQGSFGLLGIPLDTYHSDIAVLRSLAKTVGTPVKQVQKSLFD